jgi:hypothetical protein
MTVATQIRSAREATIDNLGCQVTIQAAVRQERQAGEGYQRKAHLSFGPYQCYVYWAGGGQNSDRGGQGDELTSQDRDTTWGASLKQNDGAEVWPSGLPDAMSVYELQHPVYGRCRIERVQQMSIQGANIGWQLGLTRVT